VMIQVGNQRAHIADGERRMTEVWRALCAFCEVTTLDDDQWGVWCPQCQRALRIKWV
jgi:hypothetical protein